MSVRTKSIYDAPSPADDVRVLATRYWPRGISRQHVDTYISALAPRREILRAFKDGRMPWSEFAAQYRQEMRGAAQRQEIQRLAEIAACRTSRCCASAGTTSAAIAGYSGTSSKRG